MHSRLPRAPALALLALAAASASPAAQPRYAGRPLEEVLRELQRGGLAVVYSSALVTPQMVVSVEPAATAPLDVLRAILAPFGLGVKEAPGGQVVVVRLPPGGESAAVGSIRGALESDADGVDLAGVRILVTDLGVETRSDRRGRFHLDDVPAGDHVVETASPLFLPLRLERVRVRPGRATTLRIHLTPTAGFLDHVVVTPSHFRLLREEPASRQFLSREEIARMPHLADDVFRAIKTLPGTAGGDFSAELSIRGGGMDEVLVLLDGLELYEPFHLKDFQSLFSTVDAATIGGVELLTGGFPVEYGDRMSGVMDMSVVTPTGPPTSSVGLSTFNAHVLSTGPFDEGRGHWLVSGRGWYPDVVIDAAGLSNDEIVSDYYDVLAKVEHRIGRRSSLSTDVLAAYDRLGFSARDDEDSEEVTARYASHHLWFNLRTDWSQALSSQTVLAIGKLRRERSGEVDDLEEGSIAVDDDRSFTFVSLRQDWTAAFGDRHMLKWGLDLKGQEATYSYDRESAPPSTGLARARSADARVRLAPEGSSFGAYLADRLRIGERVVAEIGLRWDRQSWLDDEQLSPRINLLYDLGPSTTARLAWGRFHQSQRLNELQVEDGVAQFFRAQAAEHWLVSLDHRFPSGLSLRLEAYRKNLTHLHPRYENLFNPLELFPEGRDDRVLVAAQRGRLQGIEALLKGGGDGRLSWWLTYTLASAEDRVDGELVARAWDQRHAASLGLNLELGKSWNLNLVAGYHSGWPTTAVTATAAGDADDVELVYGRRNGTRLPPYFRLDLRATRQLPVRSGRLTVVLDLLNATNRENVCCVDEFNTAIRDNGSVGVTTKYRYWAPIVPSIGVRWQR